MVSEQVFWLQQELQITWLLATQIEKNSSYEQRRLCRNEIELQLLMRLFS